MANFSKKSFYLCPSFIDEMMKTPLTSIEIQGLSTGYRTRGKEHVVSRRLTASLLSGELTCLLGVNGAGKSTLLRTLSAFIPPLEGKVMLLGKEVQDYTPAELSRRIGVVLTARMEQGGLTVTDMVGMGRSPYTGFWGTLSEHDKEVISQAIHLVKIEHLTCRTMDTLSDGERQKVMIAKALAQETPVIFLDEPTAFLDFPSKVELMQLLHQLAHDMEKTILLSSHDLELTLQTADRLWLLSQEDLITGTPQELAQKGHLDRFFGLPGVCFDKSNLTYRLTL